MLQRTARHWSRAACTFRRGTLAADTGNRHSMERTLATAPAPAPAECTSEVAVVGGGIAGLTCASALTKHGFKVTVFDMGMSNPGGRASTRRTRWNGLEFDHGCQFIRVRSPEFQAVVDEWQAAGVVQPWEGRLGQYDAVTGRFTQRRAAHQAGEQPPTSSGITEHDDGFFNLLAPGAIYIGMPSMDAVCKHLAANAGVHDVRHDIRVSKAHLGDFGKWVVEGVVRQPVRTEDDRKMQPPYTPWNLGAYDAVVLADRNVARAAAPGFVEVTGSSAASKMLAGMEQVGATPMLALMLGYEAAAAAGPGEQQPAGLQLPFEAAQVVNSRQICWVCDNTAKPGRARPDGLQSIVALATIEFSEELLQPGPDGALPPQTPEYLAKLAPQLFEALQAALKPLRGGKPLPPPAYIQAHRWGSAFPARPFSSACLKADSAKLAACGDFCLGAGVESAVLSAHAAAEAVAAMLAKQGSAAL